MLLNLKLTVMDNHNGMVNFILIVIHIDYRMIMTITMEHFYIRNAPCRSLTLILACPTV